MTARGEPVLSIATRRSPLARAQARLVADRLAALGVASELVLVETRGDADTSTPLADLGGQGVFVKEVQRAVLEGAADLAVHSAKDLPASGADPALLLVAVADRAERTDAIVARRPLSELPHGSVVATGSQRRMAQLHALRPDLEFRGLRGNMATRLAAIDDGADAVVVAAAALGRLGWEPPAGVLVEHLTVEAVVPQVGQGAVAVECRRDDAGTAHLLAALDLADAHRELDAERAMLAAIGGGCDLPVGGFAMGRPDGTLQLTGVLAAGPLAAPVRAAAVGPDPAAVGSEVARHLLAAVPGAADRRA